MVQQLARPFVKQVPIVAAIILGLSCVGHGQSTSPTSFVFRLRTDLRHWHAEGPQPTIITLAGDLETNLDGSYAVIADQLAKQMGALHAGIELPAHGADSASNLEGPLNQWADRVAAGQDLVQDFVQQLKFYIEYLVSHGYSDPTRIAVVGVSRGGFLALHAASQSIGITQVASVMPVVNLAALTEFQTLQQQQHPYLKNTNLALDGAAYGLYRLPILIMAGHTDVRVNTEETLNLWHALLKVGPSPQTEIRLVPSAVGHALDQSAVRYEEIADWIAEQWRVEGATTTTTTK